ncbi:MAG: DNA-processing protein DprA [Minisyncoccia bacterium]
MTIEEEEKIFYHAISASTGGNYATIRRAIRGCESWEQAHERLPNGGKVSDPETEWKKLVDQNIQLVLREDERFPLLLREIPHPPFGIYVRGTLPTNDALGIAVVGTRRATPDGKNTARRFAAELARAGIVIVSGLAFGVDAAAHEGCLNAGGKTLAVLACGLANIYPKNNEALAEKIIAQGGAIISEYPPDMPAYPSRFLERNRIVSGLSKGTLVIEAPERSGSLATARFALEQNRDVFVIPGQITHPNFKGSHELIRQGAELVTTPEHILAAEGMLKEDKKMLDTSELAPEEALVVHFLRESGAAQDIDKISVAAKLQPHIANQTVSFLLIKGMISERGDGYVIN